jgi:2'-5' RNA ligase
VSESNHSKQRYWLALFLEDLDVGQLFGPGLLHVTVLPWFVSDLTEAELIDSFNSEFNTIKKFEIKISEIAHFGPDHAVTVNLVEPEPNIMQLHQQALAWFERIRHRWAVARPHVNEDYRPHIRRRPGSELNQDEIININYLYLIAADRFENNIRRVAAKLPLL